MTIINKICLPNVLWGQNQEELIQQILTKNTVITPHGQFSFVHEDHQNIYLIRDRLGLNKLFYAIDNVAQKIWVANYLDELTQCDQTALPIFSVPAGHYLKINKLTANKELAAYYDINHHVPLQTSLDLKVLQSKLRRKLDEGFSFLKNNFKDKIFFICLSGGLDSAIIADYASRYLKNQTSVVTFSYASSDTIKSHGHVIQNPTGDLLKDPQISEDYHQAFKIAATLQLPFIAVLTERTLDEKTVMTIIKNGQDWRDFNVHCAWVNHAIAFHMNKNFPNTNNVFLTGDLMNEFVADYTPVEYKGTTYYPQPKIGKERLRRFFIYGLDAGDREIGIFDRYNSTLIQPYALLAELYLEVPENIIADPNGKRILNESLLNDKRVIDLLHGEKLRSQVGGNDGGTLGLFHYSGMTQSNLKQIWARLHGDRCDIILAGRYKS